MADNRLITLKEISRKLGVNYKTIHYYKDIFEDFVFIQFQGRRIRYQPENVYLFAKILEMKDEGYTNDDIREHFQSMKSENLKIYLSGCLAGGLSGDLDRGLAGDLSGCLDDWRSDYPTGCLTGDLDDYPSGESSDSTSERGGSEQEQGQEGEVDETSANLSQLKAELQSQLSELTDQKIKAELSRRISNLQSGLEQALLSMSAVINSPLTQFYKQIYETQEANKTLEGRLGQLENDLMGETPESIGFSELDLDQMQVSSPNLDLTQGSEQSDSIEDESSEDGEQDQDQRSPIDLEFVKKSIHNGRPDREAVIRWILAERAKNPGLSYGELANRLNEAGIPTLSGRDEWSRSVVRNLAVRGNGE